MKITGVTIIRNAVKNDYPIIEAIASILPVVDEMIVSVGDSEDETEALIRSIPSSKIKIVYSTWDLRYRKGGQILAVETNKVLKQVSADTDWIFYIQGDEVIHEQYHANILAAAQKHLNDEKVEGLLFNYLHFYGTYDYVGNSRKWYDVETRIIRNNKGIQSYRDAQGFRKANHQKIKVARINAFVYHYGWVKDPAQMKAKQKHVAAFWNEDQALEKILKEDDFFDYSAFDSIKKFTGTHPAVMMDRIQRKNWDVSLDVRKSNLKLKYRLLNWVEQATGIRLFTFRNHVVVK